LDLNQIADRLKIAPQMLEAIEADDLDRLPGSFFARSFVRQYAQALDLDEEEFEPELRRVAGFGHPASDQPGAPSPVLDTGPAPVPAARSRGPNRHSIESLVGFLLILLVCAAIYQVWQTRRASSSRPPQVAAASQTPSPTPPPAPTPTPAPPAPSPTAMPLETAAGEPSAIPAPQPSQPAPAVRAQEKPGIRVELRATSEVWVRVSGDGKMLYAGVLQPNEARVFQGAESMTLRAGNAGALAVTYNGQPMGELGTDGQVRTVQFTPSGFKFITPATAAPADEP